jgi:hypothetical protein
LFPFQSDDTYMKLTFHKKINKKITRQKAHDEWETTDEICTSCKICMVGQLGVNMYVQYCICVASFWVYIITCTMCCDGMMISCYVFIQNFHPIIFHLNLIIQNCIFLSCVHFQCHSPSKSHQKPMISFHNLQKKTWIFLWDKEHCLGGALFFVWGIMWVH